VDKNLSFEKVRIMWTGELKKRRLRIIWLTKTLVQIETDEKVQRNQNPGGGGVQVWQILD